MKYLKHILLLIFVLILSKDRQCYAQQFADKEYYLVDSLVLEELSNADKEIIETSLSTYHQSKSDIEKINALTNICDNMLHNYWKRYQFFQKQLIEAQLNTSLTVSDKKNLLDNYAAAINNIGLIYMDEGNIPEAIKYYTKSIDVQKQLNNDEGIALSLNNLGIIYLRQGNIPKAIEYYNNSLAKRRKIYSLTKNKRTILDIASNLNNIGALYKNQKEYQLALEYYNESLIIRKKYNDKEGIATAYNNIGIIYYTRKEYHKALNFYNKSLIISESLKDKGSIARSISNIAVIYNIQKETEKALSFFKQSLVLSEDVNDKIGITRALNNLGSIYLAKEDLKKAENYNLRSLSIAKKMGYPQLIKNASEVLSIVYEKKGKGVQALEMYKLHITMKDSLNNEATLKAIVKQQAKYEYEKQKVLDDAGHDKLLAIEHEEKQKQKILTYSAATGLGLVIIFLAFVFNRLQVTKKQKIVIETQKQLVEKQKETVEIAHSELEEKNKEITDSITYAKRIQNAILPPLKVVKEYLQESFILYKPKDIVAGDFYWMESVSNSTSLRGEFMLSNAEVKQSSNKGEIASLHKSSVRNDVILFAAADCTGHGVPGAMVSVVCNNALNRSVREYGLTDPGEILDKTREIVIQEFHAGRQAGEKSDEEVKDGMDIALCSLEDNSSFKGGERGMLLKYAGAHNPLWIIRNGEIIETKADKQPIGKYFKSHPFTTHTFELQKGDSIYIFSDGYVDQFGGEKGKKFKTRAFRELLLSIQDKNMEEQKIILNENFEIWRDEEAQVDDVCVIGVRI